MWGAIKAPHIFCQRDKQQSPDRQQTLDKSSTSPSLHGEFTCYGHGVVLGCFTLRASTSRLRWLDGAASATASCRWTTSSDRDYPVPTAHRWPCRRYRRVGITPLLRVPYRAVCPHRDLTRTARFVADASGLATLDLMHAPQSSPAFSLRSEVSMLPIPWHTRPLRSSWHVG